MATLGDFGIPGVFSGPILHPKQQNRWRVIFANMGGGTDSIPVSAQATTIQRPKLEWQEVELHRYNGTAFIAGKHKWQTITLTIEDDVTSSAATVLQAQLQKQQWLIGAEGQWLRAQGEGSLYKFTTYLEQLDGNDQVIERWTIEGSWIQNIDYGDLNYNTGEAVVITLTIRFDNARSELGGYNQGQGTAF